MLIPIIVLAFICTITQFMFRFKSKKSQEIYHIVWAHRGFHMSYPENTLKAYKDAVKMGCGIELDVRHLKDNHIVCFHDRYMKRLLNVPGKIADQKYNILKEYYVLDSKERVPLFSEALKMLANEVPLLVEVKGWINKRYINNLEGDIQKYSTGESRIYFHTKNIITYYILKKKYNSKVFFVCNIFRKRFEFLKLSDYKNSVKRFSKAVKNQEYLRTSEIELPTLADISALIVDEIEDNESLNGIIKKIRDTFNVYTTRIKADHWLNNSLLIHRGALTCNSYENSIDSIKECIEFAKAYNIRIAVELDMVLSEGQIKCYHNDAPSSFIGQRKATAIKNDLKTACTLTEAIQILKGYENFVSVILDIKDYHIKNREIEIRIAEIMACSEYKGNFSVQSFNPIAISYFRKHHPSFIRGQVGHSLKGIFKNLKTLNVLFVNFFFFDASLADYCVYDDSNYIWLLLKYNKDLKGRPAYIYAPRSEKEIRAYIGRQCISNYIVEDVGRHSKGRVVRNNEAWSKEFLEKYKIKKEGK